MDTLQDELRRATRNFTIPLPEDRVLALGRDLARELARAHAESPARHPGLDPESIRVSDGVPRLEGGSASGDASEDLFRLGALLHGLLAGVEPHVSWRLDGPPAAELSSVTRRYALATLAAPRRDARFPTAQAAAEAFDAALAPETESAAPWGLFRGDAARTGSRPAAAGAALAPLWEQTSGGGAASPALTATLVLCPTADGRLLFLDRARGSLVHELRLGSAVESSPALAGASLFVGNDDGELVAVDVRAGRELFRVKLGQLVRSSPLVAGDRVVVGVVDPRGAGGLACVDAAKGKLLWRTKLAACFSSPALAGSRVLVGCDDGSLHAVELETGRLVWSCALLGKVRATPAVAGELAVIADFGGQATGVRIADGATAWAQALGHAVYSSPALAAGLAVFGCNEGHIHGLDAATGEPRFSAGTRGPVVSSPAAAGERVLLGSTDGELYLADAAGQVVARRALGRGAVQSSPALDQDLVCVASAGAVHALRLTP